MAKLRNYVCPQGYSDLKIVTGEVDTETEVVSDDDETAKVEKFFQGEKLTVK